MKLDKSMWVRAGWADAPELDSILAEAKCLAQEKQITDEKYLQKLMKRLHPHAVGSLKMLAEPAPLAEAISAETKDELMNLKKVKRQINGLLKSPVVDAGAIMPDACPVGDKDAALPVGGVVVADGVIIPAAHSSDICCSMYATVYQSEVSIEEELEKLKGATRFGPGGRDEPVHHPVLDENVWGNRFLKGLQTKASVHMADQGDGNHFAFLGEMDVTAEVLQYLRDGGHDELAEGLKSYEQKTVRVLVTHHGSRGLGATVYQRGIDTAVKLSRRHGEGIPEGAAWIPYDSNEGKDYWDALQYVARWTKANHQAIHQRFVEAVKTSVIAEFGNEHNFVWKRGEKFYHGKGATPAWLEESGRPLLGLIPLNMAEPILLVLGKANKTYHEFAPHGAGRNLSRTALLKRYKTKQGVDVAAIQHDIREKTKHIKVEWYLGEPDLTETPVAYKDAQTVIAQIKQFELAEVVAMIRPRGSIMAGRSPKAGEKPLTPKQLRQMQHRKERRKVRENLRSEMDEW